MKQRGKKSAEAKNIVNLVAVDTRWEKPEPLEHLSTEQKQVWRDIVASMRPGLFNAAIFPLLASYCCHITSARFIEGELRKVNYKDDPKKYRALLQLFNGQSATMSMLATKLRLLPKENTRAIRRETDSGGQPWLIRRSPRRDDDKPAA